MAKRSTKQSPRSENEHMGCMWGLISLFDFRVGNSPQRLLSNRRHRCGRHTAGTGNLKRFAGLLTNGENVSEDTNTSVCSTSGDDKIQLSQADSNRTSVKALMDEEMSKPSHSRKHSLKSSQGQSGRSCNQTTITRKGSGDHQSQELDVYRDSETHSSRENLYSMDELCSQINQDLETHLNHAGGTDSYESWKTPNSAEIDDPTKPGKLLLTKHAILEEKESEAIEAFVIQKFKDAEQSVRDESVIWSQELIDAIEMLKLNKESFLKLMQDQNSLLAKHILELRNAQTGVKVEEECHDPVQCEEILNHKQSRRQNLQRFFRRQDKVKSKKENDTKDSKRIVVLKPGYADIQNATAVTSPRSSPQTQFGLIDQVDNETVPSHFSLREIKKKWKHVIGEGRKEQVRISMDGVLHKIPYGHQDQVDIVGELNIRDSSHNEKIHKTSATKKKDKRGKQKFFESKRKHDVPLPPLDALQNTTNVIHSNEREVHIYLEAKKHLAEMLNNGDEEKSELKQLPRTLGRMLSLPEFMSPRTSPQCDYESNFLPEQITSPNSNFQSNSKHEQAYREEAAAPNHLSHSPNTERLATSNNKEDNEGKLSSSTFALVDGLPSDTSITCINKDSSQRGEKEIEELTNVECLEESDFIGIPSGLNLEMPNAENYECTNETDIGKEDTSSECLKLELEEHQELGSPSALFSKSPLRTRKIEDTDSTCEKTDRPSPVSVLEPYYVEDTNCEKCPKAHRDEVLMESRKIHFEEYSDSTLNITISDPEIYPRTFGGEKESEFTYIKSVMEASGLSCKEFIGRCHSSSQPLSPLLFEGVEASSTQSPDTQRLLFDFINEILMEVFERYFGCTPWVSLVKPNAQLIPTGKYTVQEIWKRIDWHLFHKVPHELDQIVGKDMEKAGRWMDLHFDIEGINVELEDSIVKDLLEETIHELID